MEEWAGDRDHFAPEGSKVSWFVELGRTNKGQNEVELWVLQSGARPGSDYLLLATSPASGLIKSFDLLSVICPSEFQRKGHAPDIWLADYCAINSPAELRAFAQEMAKRPPVGTLTFVEGPPAKREPK